MCTAPKKGNIFPCQSAKRECDLSNEDLTCIGPIQSLLSFTDHVCNDAVGGANK